MLRWVLSQVTNGNQPQVSFMIAMDKTPLEMIVEGCNVHGKPG